MENPVSNNKKILASVSGVIIAAGAAYGSFYSYSTYVDLQQAEDKLSRQSENFEENMQELEDQLAETRAENESIQGLLTQEQKKALDLEREKRRNEREIDELTKLATLDPELLKKYSKVYFLSENYTPERLRDIEEKYLIDPSKEIEVLRNVEPFLEDLLEEAEDDNVELRVVSGYRSFENQRDLKSGYVVQYGSGANAFSAEQGYSEHQLGTTVDFTTPQLRGLGLAFENTEAFKWLTENADKYGFTLSYPKNNSFYVFEPWHWRFVGRDLADDLKDDDKYFYELDQRDIDEYLIKIFD